MNTATQRQLSQDILTKAVRNAPQPLRGAADHYDALLKFIGDVRFVLIGEATHGTNEFYPERAQITIRLIHEKGFAAVTVDLYSLYSSMEAVITYLDKVDPEPSGYGTNESLLPFEPGSPV